VSEVVVKVGLPERKMRGMKVEVLEPEGLKVRVEHFGTEVEK